MWPSPAREVAREAGLCAPLRALVCSLTRLSRFPRFCWGGTRFRLLDQCGSCALLAWAADERNDLFPVIWNATEDMLDELALVAKFTHTCFVVAEGPLPPRRASVIGPLDPGQRATLEALVVLQAVTGAELERQRPAENIKATAWNNRLKDLYNKRLLRRERRGREQVYSPILEELVLHG